MTRLSDHCDSGKEGQSERVAQYRSHFPVPGCIRKEKRDRGAGMSEHEIGKFESAVFRKRTRERGGKRTGEKYGNGDTHSK